MPKSFSEDPIDVAGLFQGIPDLPLLQRVLSAVVAEGEAMKDSVKGVVAQATTCVRGLKALARLRFDGPPSRHE